MRSSRNAKPTMTPGSLPGDMQDARIFTIRIQTVPDIFLAIAVTPKLFEESDPPEEGWDWEIGDTAEEAIGQLIATKTKEGLTIEVCRIIDVDHEMDPTPDIALPDFKDPSNGTLQL